MRCVAAILLCLGSIVGGCASKSKPSTNTSAPLAISPTASAAGEYDGFVAAALVFDPPIAANEQPLDLARDTRERTAFVGYDEMTTTFFNVSTVDIQRTNNFNGWGDRYERAAFSSRFGVSFR